EAGDRPPKKPAARAFPPRREGTSSGRAARSSEACPEAREEAPRATRHKQLRRRRPRGAAAGETSPSDERLRWKPHAGSAPERAGARPRRCEGPGRQTSG
ncbi:unnamed protein product, partial [Prorocentrum cordatum]